MNPPRAIFDRTMDPDLPAPIHSDDVSACQDRSRRSDGLLVADVQGHGEHPAIDPQFLSNHIAHRAVQDVCDDPAMQKVRMCVEPAAEGVEPSYLAEELLLKIGLSVEGQQVWDRSVSVEGVAHQ